jgi:hypothetical protein
MNGLEDIVTVRREASIISSGRSYPRLAHGQSLDSLAKAQAISFASSSQALLQHHHESFRSGVVM